MGLCIATASVPGVLADKIEAIALAGFDSADLAWADIAACPGGPDEIRQLFANNRLSIALVASAKTLEAGQQVNQFQRELEITASLNTDLLMIDVGKGLPTQEQLTSLAMLAEKNGVRIALRPTNAQDAQLADQVAQLANSSIGLAINSAFALSDGSNAARLRDLPADKVLHVQLTDEGFGKQRWPGQGNLNMASFVRVISRNGYKGAWDVEAPGLERDAARNGYRALVTLLDEVSQTEPAFPLELPTLPGRVYASGFEFIEFATSPENSKELTALLSSMAFRMERSHVSKDVELWRQGAINIVVNKDLNGHARDVLERHGPSVCDMGLRVKDAAQTIARATAFGTPSFHQPVGIGELEIPAVQGVGGNVVHFIDENSELHRVWDIEFRPVSKTEATPPSGLRRIDHVAQTMSHDEMQSWLLTYITLFEMEKSAILDVRDPSGVVRSQALESPEGEVRLNLNGALNRQTLAGSFVADRMGAGVQHIALLTDDIMETAQRLEQSGFPSLPIPPSYYAETQALFGLSDTLTDQLRQHCLLYDEDEKGAYFQLYSQPIFNGFFFEIVQRKSGYNGYGARNASVRLAAQAGVLSATIGLREAS